MSANFLHGVETLEINRGPVPVRIVKSSVIGLVGVSPLGPRQQLVELLSERDAAQFGFGSFSGGTIGQALAAINAQGAGNVLVVNVFDPAKHLEDITAEPVDVSGKVFQLSKYPSGAITVLDGATTVYTGTSYGVTDLGRVTLPSDVTIADGEYTVTYKTLDLSAVESADIIGAINSTTNARTGVKIFDLAYNLLGYKPKILIAPIFVEVAAVANELIARAQKLKAIALIDAPGGATMANVITGRGPSGTINFNVANERAVLLYPRVKAFDASINETIDQPYSQFFAGVICRTDFENGYWWSPSNKSINLAEGLERALDHDATDPQSDTNRLNEVGIVTIANSFGSGFKTWGNRSSAFPSSTNPKQFIVIRRIADIVHESLERAAEQFQDRPLDQVFIDIVRDSGNAFFNVLAQRGAVFPGSEVVYDPAKNPPVQIAAGHVTFDLVFMGPTPAERITFESFLDINLLRQLN